MSRPLRRIKARNYRSLAGVNVEFRDLSVLIGPNGSGKTNLLSVLRFLRDTAKQSIPNAILESGGWEAVVRQAPGAKTVELTVEARVSTFASTNALDKYTLRLEEGADGISRAEELQYKRVAGRGRRTILRSRGQEVFEDPDSGTAVSDLFNLRLKPEASALGFLAQMIDARVGDGPRDVASFLSEIRYLDPDVDRARRPSRRASSRLSDDAGNLSWALHALREHDSDAFLALERDLARCLPGLRGITFESLGGPSSAVVAQLDEEGLRSRIDLADASFGTVRVLALLAALHDPEPPAVTVIEEVDHGLHPYALDVLVDRLRAASDHTQIIVASHSPTLVNRLEPTEIIICDRDPASGASLIPATSSEEIADAVAHSDWRAGELWFSGLLGGVPR